jgi:nucleoside-diphosphate-sugar epimerase
MAFPAQNLPASCRVFITGSSGQLGSLLAQKLRDDGYLVVGLDARAGPHTEFIGSVSDRELVFAAVARGVDAIVHVASLHAPQVATHARDAFVETNVTGTRNVLDAALAFGVRRVVYTSTTSVYGRAMEDPDRAVWVTEELTPVPRDVYDETKLAAEQLCREASQSHGLECVVLRTGRFFDEPPEVMARFRLYRGVDARDVADAHELALTATLPAKFELVNIASDSPFRRDECEELCRDAAGLIRRRLPDVARAFARRGWALPGSIDRVYVIGRATAILNYRARFNVNSLLT